MLKNGTKNMKNKVIQGLWIGDKLSPIERMCINSFIKNGHEFHLYVYNSKISDNPPGTILKDANEIIPACKIYKDEIDTYTSFANWFRYELLFQRGGWWVDMDVICLQYFNFTEDYCFTTETIFDAGPAKIIANNGIIKAPQEAEFLKDMLDYMATRDLTQAKWGEFGSRFLQKVLNLYDSYDYIQPPYVFCPINWHEIDLLFDKNLAMSFDKSNAIHLWNNIWRRNGIDKNAQFHPNSLIEKLKRDYLQNSL